MPIELLTLLKFVLLFLLYVFIARTMRAVTVDLYGQRRRSPAPPRPAVAAPASTATRRSRKIPRQIVVHGNSNAPAVVRLIGRGVVIGRGPSADVALDDVYVSDEHAEILPDEGGWSIRDLGSTNGTFLNDAKVMRPTQLAAGDRLRVGKTQIEVRR